MVHETGNLILDETRLFTQQWVPEDGFEAAVVIVHGLAEHSGRYAHVAEFFNRYGFAVFALDLPGHGQSDGPRAYFSRFEVLIDAVHAYVLSLKASHPDLKLFMLGHSLGGAIALDYAANFQETLAGLVVTGPSVKLGEAVPTILKSLAGIMSVIAPKLKIMALDAGDISRDPDIRASYDSDPLNYRGKLTARAGAELLELAEAARTGAPLITIPALVMQGGEDALVDPSSADEVYGLLGSADKTKRIFHGLYHEILNEPEKEQVMGEIAAWMVAR